MIINFSFQNFGSIKEKQTLSFEATKSKHLEEHFVVQVGKFRLLKMALLYGANASGKTTVLQALFFLQHMILYPEDTKTEKIAFNPFLFDTETPHQNTVFSIDFIQSEIRYSYEVAFNENYIAHESLYVFNPNKALVYTRTTDAEKELAIIKFGDKFKKNHDILATNTLWNNTVLGGFLKTNIEFKELKVVTEWFEKYLQELVNTNTRLESYATNRIKNSITQQKIVTNILQKADFNISNILLEEREKEKSNIGTVIGNILKNIFSKKIDYPMKMIGKLEHISVKFEHTVDDQKYELPFDSESEGTQRYYGFAGLLALLISDSIILPIDELESSLHPDLYVHFLLSFLMNAKQSQLIATTHNREILGDRDLFRPDAIWFTDKSDGCATKLYSLADFDSATVRDTTNVLNAYKIGKLGGAPRLADYYIDHE
ncbi:MAG: hypothetical protein RL757_13 [Bacteroidota bacterium]|jgi:AAA15 family ATPase/GTPase